MRLLALFLLVAALAGPPEAESCGPFFMDAQFSYVATPPPDVFARGQLGILRPRYYRRYLVVAYRYLAGAPLNAEEQKAFAFRREAVIAREAPLDPVGQWLEARKQVAGAAKVERIDVFRQAHDPAAFAESYQNCLDDAFVRATRTLRQRTQTWGPNSPRLKDWLAAQDTVFQNCSAGKQIPPPASDPVLAADRRYQVAAAEFYSEDYSSAERDFAAIAADTSSPWQDLGELMVARTQIRQYTIRGDEEKLDAAQETLEAIEADPKLGKWSTAVRGLREFIAARVDPEAQLLALGERLVKPQDGSAFSQALTDFTLLWDRQQGEPPHASDLTDWIATFQAGGWEHAVERWRADHKDQWLVAALLAVPHDNAAVPELLAAAHEVRPGAPAWASATFYGISLERARGNALAARTWADEALAAVKEPDVRNEILAHRMALARGWEEFLKYAPRTPVALGGDVGQDEPLEDQPRRNRLFDADFTKPFNRETPLERWIDAASNRLLPRALQRDIARAGWVRAILLDGVPQARTLAARWGELEPAFRSPLEEWSAERDPGAARFLATLLLLRNPGLEPVVRPEFGRRTAVGKIDDFRDNWWDPSRWQSGAEPEPPFLPAQELEAGQRQLRDLVAKAGVASDYLCAQTLSWARSHPDDPRVPEALHLAIRTTRYTSAPHGKTYPSQVFSLLHQRYPNSKWAKMTPYWY